jgi:hypothetical protein
VRVRARVNSGIERRQIDAVGGSHGRVRVALRRFGDMHNCRIAGPSEDRRQKCTHVMHNCRRVCARSSIRQ